MKLFGPRQVADQEARDALQRLQDALESTQRTVRSLELEQQTMHDQVRKWMRRAVAAERVVEQNQEPAAAPTAPVTPAPARLWGARARRLMRGAPVPDPTLEDEANGVHS